MGRPNLVSARSTISMARSTPAQKPRGSAKIISACALISQHSDQLDLKTHGLASQGVVEVKKHGLLPQLHHHTAELALAVRRGEVHHVTDTVFLVRVPELAQFLAREPLLHVRVFVAIGAC